MKLTNKVLISGASGALGSALQLFYEKEGASVTTLGKVDTNIVCDFADKNGLQNLQTLLSAKDFDLVILCHATPETLLMNSDPKSLDRAQQYFLINYWSTVLIIDALYKQGDITFVVLLGGGVGGTPLEGSRLYVPLKAALATFIESSSSEMSKWNNIIVGVSPGQVSGGIGSRILADKTNEYSEEVLRDAERVESSGQRSSDVAERIGHLVESVRSIGSPLNGRLFSAVHDSLGDLFTLPSINSYRLRRII